MRRAPRTDSMGHWLIDQRGVRSFFPRVQLVLAVLVISDRLGNRVLGHDLTLLSTAEPVVWMNRGYDLLETYYC